LCPTYETEKRYLFIYFIKELYAIISGILHTISGCGDGFELWSEHLQLPQPATAQLSQSK